jgi:hypothetical protein
MGEGIFNHWFTLFSIYPAGSSTASEAFWSGSLYGLGGRFYVCEHVCIYVRVCVRACVSIIYCHTLIIFPPGSTPPGVEEYIKRLKVCWRLDGGVCLALSFRRLLTATSAALVHVRLEVASCTPYLWYGVSWGLVMYREKVIAPCLVPISL